MGLRKIISSIFIWAWHIIESKKKYLFLMWDKQPFGLNTST